MAKTRQFTTGVRQFSIKTTAKILQKSPFTVRRWIKQRKFSDVIRVSDGFKIPENSRVKCCTHINGDGRERQLTIGEIIRMNKIKI